jgi:hypothetical protein
MCCPTCASLNSGSGPDMGSVAILLLVQVRLYPLWGLWLLITTRAGGLPAP